MKQLVIAGSGGLAPLVSTHRPLILSPTSSSGPCSSSRSRCLPSKAVNDDSTGVSSTQTQTSTGTSSSTDASVSGRAAGRQERAYRRTQNAEARSNGSRPRFTTETTLLAAGLAGAGVLALLYRQFSAGLASKAQATVSGTTQAMAQGLQQKQLQKGAQMRLNEFSDRVRNSPSPDLSAQNLSDEGTAYVVEALAFNTSCLALDLSKNGIGKTGFVALCEVLPTSSLQTLVVSTNNAGDEGAEVLARTVAGNSTLRILDVASNGIGDFGAQAIAEGLKYNTTLLKLDLSSNTIDEKGTGRYESIAMHPIALKAVGVKALPCI
uniref:Uncharacterized protein n=1 Tax=Dunaliella tertiolecta TaxID=3047 RepID=A0A7S3R5U0_DUNTE